MSGGPEAAAVAPAVVETEVGRVTLATVSELRAILEREESELEHLQRHGTAVRRRSEDELANVGLSLADRMTAAPSSPELADRLATARWLLQKYRRLDGELNEMDTRSLARRIGTWTTRHRMEHERDQTRDRLQDLGAQIGEMASDDDLAVLAVLADPGALLERRTRARRDLSEARSHVEAASSRVTALREEVAQRESIVRQSGFDPFHAVASLVVNGPSPRPSPLELRGDEVLYHATDATLARMQRRTRYTGVSQGISIPLGHGFRYRVGEFQSKPVATDVLARLDEGVLAVTTRRLAFLGRTKSVTVPLAKVLHVEPYRDAISVFREGRENPDFFLTANPAEVHFYVAWVMREPPSGAGS